MAKPAAAKPKTKKTKPRKLKLPKKGIVKRKKPGPATKSRRIRCSALPKIKCTKARPCAWSKATKSCFRAPPPFRSNSRAMERAAARWMKLGATPEARARKAKMPWIAFYKAYLRSMK